MLFTVNCPRIPFNGTRVKVLFKEIPFTTQTSESKGHPYKLSSFKFLNAAIDGTKSIIPRSCDRLQAIVNTSSVRLQLQKVTFCKISSKKAVQKYQLAQISNQKVQFCPN